MVSQETEFAYMVEYEASSNPVGTVQYRDSRGTSNFPYDRISTYWSDSWPTFIYSLIQHTAADIIFHQSQLFACRSELACCHRQPGLHWLQHTTQLDFCRLFRAETAGPTSSGGQAAIWKSEKRR